MEHRGGVRIGSRELVLGGWPCAREAAAEGTGRLRGHFHGGLLGLVIALWGGACDGDGGQGGAADAGSTIDAGLGEDAAPPGIEWTSCEDEPDDDCATILVPRHYDDPAGEQIELPLVRLLRADPAQRLGTIIVYLGGTGSAIETLRNNRTLFWLVPDVATRFDVVAFDRRGARHTAAFSCVDDAWLERSRAVRMMPRDDDEWAELDAVFRDYIAACADDYEPAGWLGSDQVAHDLERVREALREPKLTILTHSHMTYAATLYARLYPNRVRAIAIDGLAGRPSQTAVEYYEQRASGHEAALMDALAHCAGDPTCAFHGGASVEEVTAAYDALAAQLAATPMAVGDRMLRDRDLAAAVWLLVSHVPPLSSSLDYVVAPIANALAAAEAGDGSLLLEQADLAALRRADETYDVQRISQRGGLLRSHFVCPSEFDLTAARELWDRLATFAPRLGWTSMEHVLYCLHATGLSEPLEFHAPDAPPLFLGTGTTSQTCGVECTTDYAAALGNGSHVVVVDKFGGAPWIGHSACYRESIQQFLVDPEHWTPPPDGICTD